MKSLQQVTDEVRRRLERTWHQDIAAGNRAWPHRFALGSCTKTELETGWQRTYQPLVSAWCEWAAARPGMVIFEARRVYITTQDIPTHLEIDSIDTAAELVGGTWPKRVAQARERLAQIARYRFPGLAPAELPNLVRALDRYSDVDFALLLAAAIWFQVNDGAGYTPRQVPIDGVHAKFLNAHQPEILALTGREALGLLPPHPARIHFTYLDPAYRADGGRLHDSATVGDRFTPPYQPDVVVISENKDTAIHFPPVRGGISVEGAGFGGKAAAAFAWLTGCRRIVYWGDIDADGYEVLNGWRADGVDAVSMLMDAATYARYARFGTSFDRKGNPIKPRTPRPLPHLVDHERAMYELVLSDELKTHRRIEQERIPLSEAVSALAALARQCGA